VNEISARTFAFLALLAIQALNGPYPLLSLWSINPTQGHQSPFNSHPAFIFVRIFIYYRRYRCRKASKSWAWSALWFSSLRAATTKKNLWLSSLSRSASNLSTRANTSNFAGRALKSALAHSFSARISPC
jgi:hypothetical protein